MNSFKQNISSVFRDGANPATRRLRGSGKNTKKVTWAPDVLDNSNSVGSLGAPVIILCAELADVSESLCLIFIFLETFFYLMPHWSKPCLTMPHHTTPHHTIPSHVMPCHHFFYCCH